MYEVAVFDSPTSDWDDGLLLGETGSLFLYQSTAWAERLKELLSYRPVYFVVRKEGKLQACLQGFIAPPVSPPQDSTRVRKLRYQANVLISLVKRRRNFLWYGQPVVFDTSDREIYKVLAQTVSDYLGAERARLIHGEWPIVMRDELPDDWLHREWATLLVDLNQEENALFEGLKASARKEIRKAGARGITVKRVETVAELRTYHDFARECGMRYGKEMLGFEDYETMWRYLRPWGHFETFVASFEEEMIAGLSIWGDRIKVAELGSFQSQSAYERKLGGPDLVKWEALRWARSAGVLSFDLSGVNPAPDNEKEASIRKFKEKWSINEQRYLIVHSIR